MGGHEAIERLGGGEPVIGAERLDILGDDAPVGARKILVEEVPLRSVVPEKLSLGNLHG